MRVHMDCLLSCRITKGCISKCSNEMLKCTELLTLQRYPSYKMLKVRFITIMLYQEIIRIMSPLLSSWPMGVKLSALKL